MSRAMTQNKMKIAQTHLNSSKNSDWGSKTNTSNLKFHNFYSLVKLYKLYANKKVNLHKESIEFHRNKLNMFMKANKIKFKDLTDYKQESRENILENGVEFL